MVSTGAKGAAKNGGESKRVLLDIHNNISEFHQLNRPIRTRRPVPVLKLPGWGSWQPGSGVRPRWFFRVWIGNSICICITKPTAARHGGAGLRAAGCFFLSGQIAANGDFANVAKGMGHASAGD
jgi:hypothetical protein